MVEAIKGHPAKFSPGVVDKMGEIIERYDIESLFDPMAGNGEALAALALKHDIDWAGSEIEPEWAALHPQVMCADSRKLPVHDGEWDCVFTSPGYANRMGDQYIGNAEKEKCRACMGAGEIPVDDPEFGLVEADCAKCAGTGRAKSTRRGYAVSLDRRVSAGSGCQYSSFSRGYRELHLPIIAEMIRVAGRLIVLNVSDSLASKKKGRQERQYVTQWWVEQLMLGGARFMEAHTVPTARMKQGQNWEARIEGEQVLVFGVEDKRERRLL